MSSQCGCCGDSICNQQSCVKRCCAGGSMHKKAVCNNCFPSDVQMKAGRGRVTVASKRFKRHYEEFNFPSKWKGTQDLYIRETGISCMREDCQGMVYICSVRRGTVPDYFFSFENCFFPRSSSWALITTMNLEYWLWRWNLRNVMTIACKTAHSQFPNCLPEMSLLAWYRMKEMCYHASNAWIPLHAIVQLGKKEGKWWNNIIRQWIPHCLEFLPLTSNLQWSW